MIPLLISFLFCLAVFFLVKDKASVVVRIMEFDLISFTFSPTIEVFERCRKADLFLIADFFNIEVSRQDTKQVIKDYLREKLADEGILPDYSTVCAGEQPGFTAEAVTGEVLPGPVTESLGESMLAVKLKELDLQIKKQECEGQKIRLRAIEAQADRDIKMGELDLHAQELNRRPVPMPRSRLPSALSSVTSPAAVSYQDTDNVTSEPDFDVGRYLKLVSPFREAEVDLYFVAFERVATKLRWPKDVWALLLQCSLSGKAQEVCSALPADQSVDYDTAQQLIHKLVQLGLNTSLCNWLLDFLTGRPQAVRVGTNTSSTITLNTGAPQGCVLSPLLFTLLTHDCTPSHNSNRFIKFADDTTVVGLISNRDETNYRSEVSRLAGWCSDNNLSLNVEKTKEIVVDFRRVHSLHAPLTINGATVERVSSTKFLGVHITEDLSWTNNTAALAKKAQQRLYFLRKLRRARAPAPIMCTFYRGTIECILTSCITVWYGACNASCRKSLQRIVRAAEKIVGVSLPSLQDTYNTRLTRKALSIAGDPTHPTHNFFSLLPSGRRLRSLQARTNRLKDSFIHQAVRKLNSLPSLPPLPSLTPRITEI